MSKIPKDYFWNQEKILLMSDDSPARTIVINWNSSAKLWRQQRQKT